MQKFATFLSSLRRRGQPGYVLAGRESLLCDEAERAILEAVLGDEAGTGLVVLDGGREGEPVEAADVLDEARTGTLLGGRKVVCVRRAGAIVKKSVDAFVSYLQDPAPDATLVIHFETWDRKTAAAKALDRWAVDCGPLYETEFNSPEISAGSKLGEWVRSRASLRGLVLGPDAVVRLIELVGTNMAELDGALARLAVAAKEEPGAQVGAADVDEAVAPSRGYTMFRVAELAVSGKRREALAAAEACFEQGLVNAQGTATLGESKVAAGIQWAIARELEVLYAARGLVNEGQRVKPNAGKVGVPPFRADAVERLARAVPQERIERALELAFETELAVKSGEADARFAVERLILGLGR